MGMREEFEAHIYATPFYGYSPGELLERDEADQGYIDAPLHGYWLAWQASRATLVVTLPRSGCYAGYDNPSMMEADEVRDALIDAGVSYK